MTLEDKTVGVPFMALQAPQCWKVLNFYPLYAKRWDSIAEESLEALDHGQEQFSSCRSPSDHLQQLHQHQQASVA